MKTFPSNFITEKNKKTGASPVWILKCPFPSTGDIYLSDQAFSLTTGVPTDYTMAWIKSWGQIDENISGAELAASQVSDFSINVITDPNASPNIDTILWNAANNIETTDLELYLWFLGLDAANAPPQLMWVGNIVDFQRQDELSYTLQMADQSVRLDKIIGTVIDAATYPNADPDEIGKVANILYGASKQVRCQAIASGAIDTIVANITATSPDNGGVLQISDASEFPASGAFTIQVDYEQIRVASRSGNALTLAASGARGYGGTAAMPHNKGAAAYQLITQFVYNIADHPVKTIGDILVDGVRQTTGFAKYTGQSGSELAGYSGKAVVAFTVLPTIYKQVNLGVGKGSHLHDTSETLSVRIPTSASNTNNYNVLTTNSVDNIRDQSDATHFRIRTADFAFSPDSNGNVNAFFPSYGGPPPTSISLCVTHTSRVGVIDANNFIKINGIQVDNSQTTVTQKFAVAAVPTTVTMQMQGRSNVAFDSYVYEIWVELTTSVTAASGADGVALSGNSVADTVIGTEVVATVDGYQDDASGTYTGTANALIERPNHIIGHFLNVYAAVALANFSTNADSYFSTNAYKFSIVINERKKLKEWLADMAWQCRCYFRFAARKAILTLRPDSLTTQKSITANMIRMQDDFKTTLKVARSPLEEIINKIKIYYNRDWLKTGEDAYKAISSTSDTTSITRYGEKEKPGLFFFDFITLQPMADHVRNFYLARYKNRKKVLEMEVFLDNSEIDFADALTIVPQSSLLCEVQKANIYPGSGKEMRNDRINLVVKEY